MTYHKACNLEKAYIIRTNLKVADLEGTIILLWANLDGANLIGSQLTWANL
jgi:uncharacterized protein YjbI with pentapeptide repeats